jgi:hypothetical protein
MRRLVKPASWVLAALCAAGFLLSFPVRANLEGQSAMIQVVRKDSAAGLFEGESSLVNVGTPQRAILTDTSVKVEGPDKALVYADAAAMDAKGIRPLQMKTVDFVVSNARIGLGAGFLVFLGLGFWQRRTNKGP